MTLGQFAANLDCKIRPQILIAPTIHTKLRDATQVELQYKL